MRACPLTNAFKNAARRKYALVVHATDTVNETVDNLKALGISYQAAVQLQRPHWSCIEEVLQALDTVCTYVLMRDFEPYTAGSRPPREVDLLVSNFKQAQVVLGGVPASAPWQMVGSGGNHSSFSVIVAGKAVKFDVRHVGDGYMDQTWAERVLHRRVFHPVNRFYVPSPHDHFHTLLYHSVVHKDQFVHIQTLLQNALTLQRTGLVVSNLAIGALKSASWEGAVRALSAYMDPLNYAWTRPNDPSVFFRIDWEGETPVRWRTSGDQ